MSKEGNYEAKLRKAMEKFVCDPLGFVYFAYEWGKGVLADEAGPDEWQSEILRLIGKGTLNASEAIRIAVRSGHGIGKTALIGWIIHWFMSTRSHPQIVVTANTSSQLSDKTWRELAKWWKLSINKHWFEWTKTKFYLKEHSETWFAVAQPWTKERSEAFAGTHEKHVLFLFDEASAIDDIIWEVAEGAMTTPGAMWIAFGNPTRNTGRFSECFKKQRHRWTTREIDSRTARKADKKQIKEWIEDYGEDSDFVRVRVKGQEPRTGSMQFIGNELVETAMARKFNPGVIQGAPKILGVDCARFGEDRSVLVVRQGICVYPLRAVRNLDSMRLGDLIYDTAEEQKVDAVMLDIGSFGAAVYDYLVHKRNRKDVIPVDFGSSPKDGKVYLNKRAEIWGLMKQFLMDGGCLPNDNELRDDLTGPEFGYNIREQIMLEKKTDMKKRGLASPDKGDALACTFAVPVRSRREHRVLTAVDRARQKQVVFEPFSSLR